MRMPRIRAASAALYLVALLAFAMVLAAKFQPAAAMRPVSDIRSAATANAAHQAHARDSASKTPAPTPSPAPSSSPASVPTFIVSLLGAFGVGAIGSAYVTARRARKHDEGARADEETDRRRQERKEKRDQVDGYSEALNKAAWTLFNIRVGLEPGDDDALSGSVKAVIDAHALFRKSARDAEIVLGTTNRLSGPADGVMNSTEALLNAVPTDAGPEQLQPLLVNVIQALNRFNTSLSLLVQERGGAA